jgi:predicted ATPase/class 3 adenylate cyclase
LLYAHWRNILIIPPSGTITFLFTDIEGSTRLWERDRTLMQHALARHDELMRLQIEANGGYVFKTVGDAFCAAFQTAGDAMLAALECQHALAEESWDVPGGIRVRMAIHTGACQERDGDYFGRPLNRIARLLSIGYGSQTLVSLVSSELLRDILPDTVTLRDLGAHRLKDLNRPESVFQLDNKDSPTEFPPLKSLDQHPNNLPIQPNPFIGREREMLALRALLLDHEARVITLTGPGGTGKTRLSMQLAAEATDIFPDGVYFIDLSAIDQPEYLYPAIARTIGLHESGARTFREQLWDALHDRQMLLILDNFEQLMAASSLVDKLQAACPQAKFIVTSREALRIRAERVFKVSSLNVPKPGVGTALTSLSQYDAVTLFLERATAINADFKATNDNAPAIAEICARLEGLPLAIELAAARVDLLSPQAILQRLGNILGLLTRGATDLPFRQRTLRAAIDWSYRLLTEDEQTLFCHLSVFAGGFTAEAMERVCADGRSKSSTFDRLSSLVAKSHVSRLENTDGESRFRLSEPIREFARELLLTSGELESAADAHAGYYLSIAEECANRLDGPEQHRAMNTLDDEHDNLATAFEHFVVQENIAGQLCLCGALRLFWIVRGHLAEGREFCNRALANSNHESAPIASTWLCAGSLARATGDYQSATSLLEKAMDRYKTLGDADGWGLASYEYGMTMFRKGEISLATTVFKQILGYIPEIDKTIKASAHIGLGMIEANKADFDSAVQHFDEGKSVFSATGNERQLAHALGNLANVYFSLGNLSQYCSLMEETIQLDKKIGALDDLAVSFNNSGYCHACLDEHEKATECYRELEAIAKKTGNPRMLVLACTGQSDSMRKTGDPGAALHHAERALGYASQLGDCVELAVTLRVLGDAYLETGNIKKAYHSFERAVPLLERFIEYADKEDLKQAMAGLQSAHVLIRQETGQN